MRWEGGRNESILVGVPESSDMFLVRGRLTHSTGIERTLDLYSSYIYIHCINQDFVLRAVYMTLLSTKHVKLIMRFWLFVYTTTVFWVLENANF